MKRTLIVSTAICALLASAIYAFGDIARPKTSPAPAAKTVLYTSLTVTPDSKLYEARLQISQRTLQEIAKEAGNPSSNQSTTQRLMHSSPRTIMAGLFAGEMRETAARFSFLLSIPAVLASGLLELKEALHKLPHGSYGSLAVATIVSGIVGYASIWFLLRYLRTHSTGVFIGYRLIVGGLILAALFKGYITAAVN